MTTKQEVHAVPSRKARLLVVDDEPGNLFTIKRVLRLKYDIRLALSGAEALALLADTSGTAGFDAVLIDYAMPVMNGAELLAKLRTGHPDLPCLFLTAYAEIDEVKAASRRHGVVAVIMKPWELADLQRWIDHSIGIARMKSSTAKIRR